jgi:hypothetical protein
LACTGFARRVALHALVAYENTDFWGACIDTVVVEEIWPLTRLITTCTSINCIFTSFAIFIAINTQVFTRVFKHSIRTDFQTGLVFLIQVQEVLNSAFGTACSCARTLQAGVVAGVAEL